MNRILFFILFQFLVVVFSFAQSASDSSIIAIDSTIQIDSLAHKDSLTIVPIADSISRRPQKNMSWHFAQDSFFSDKNLSFQILQHHPYFNFSKEPIVVQSDIKSFHGNELLFYVLVFLLLVYALLRRTFSKYFNDLFRLFFRTTLKQLQVREQMMQTPLPSFLLNVFFVVSTGLYISFLLKRELVQQGFWLTFLYCTTGLSFIYIVKFVGLKISGWLFNMKAAADSYIFIVFIINKMIGLLLLPFLILLAYAQENIYAVSQLLSWIVLIAMLVYRFILTYSAVRKQVKVNPFHFFLYLCAFEIAPLLLIYKGLLVFLHITT